MSEPEPASDDAAPGASPEPSPQPAGAGDHAPGLGWLAGPICLVLLAGLAVAPHFGVVAPLVLAVVMAAVGQRWLGAITRARAQLHRAPAATRLGLLLVTLGTAGVLLTVLTRGVAALLVSVPASLWGAAAALVAAIVVALVGSRIPARGRPVLLLVLAVAIPMAGVWGTRYESQGEDARGWAHSGPILGIHPFQITAILVDGEGPFDLALNDYVEPDGSRGYGPQALADAIDRALVAVADRVYPDGPERMRRALIDAEVETVTTPAVHERLDREPFDETQARFVVRSGSFGMGSSVELVCPGRRVDPRGPQGESVMNRMCPDKYASEGSAGLGVTGRWSGYSEGRGNARAGLFRLRGWTRGTDDEGLGVIERETRIWAWILLALVAASMARPVAGVGRGLRGIGGALGVISVVVLVVATFSAGRAPVVGAWSAGPHWGSWTDPVVWAPVLALGGLGLFALEGPASKTRSTGPARAIAVPAILVVVATLALAAALPALAWVFPVHGADGAALPTFVRGLAEAVDQQGGLTIFEVEGALGATLAAILMGGAAAVAGAGLAGMRRLWPAPAPDPVRPIAAVVAMVLVASALVVSRKTMGASALMPGVIGMTVVLSSALGRISSGSRPSIPSTLAHLTWTALGLVLVWSAVAPLPDHWMVTLCRWLGVGGVLTAGVGILVGRASSEGDDTLESPGSGRL